MYVPLYPLHLSQTHQQLPPPFFPILPLFPLKSIPNPIELLRRDVFFFDLFISHPLSLKRNLGTLVSNVQSSGFSSFARRYGFILFRMGCIRLGWLVGKRIQVFLGMVGGI